MLDYYYYNNYIIFLRNNLLIILELFFELVCDNVNGWIYDIN